MTPLDTVTHGCNPHAVPTTTEFPPTHVLIPTDTIEEAEPLLPQLVTPTSPLATAPIQLRPSPINKPTNWNEMSANAQRRWWQIQKHKK